MMSENKQADTSLNIISSLRYAIPALVLMVAIFLPWVKIKALGVGLYRTTGAELESGTVWALPVLAIFILVSVFIKKTKYVPFIELTISCLVAAIFSYVYVEKGVGVKHWAVGLWLVYLVGVYNFISAIARLISEYMANKEEKATTD